jgi:Protein of unknown function (DUF1566)/PEP-CTERM motif
MQGGGDTENSRADKELMVTGLKKMTLALATAGILSSGAAQAVLFDRGGGLIYDNVLNITWLSDANYAQTSGYDSDGVMNFSAANTWAANLSYGGYTDWRLPTTMQPDATCSYQTTISAGYGCTGSEMGHMFYNNLGATAGNDILSGSNIANLALFTNLQSYYYWSGTVFAPVPADLAWYFATRDGAQSPDDLPVTYYAWAVRPGDVAAAIPEPETYAMLLAGLGLLGFAARRRQQKTA